MDAAAFDYLRGMVKQHAAIVLEPGKEYVVESKLSGLARERGLDQVTALIGQLRLRPFGELHRRVIELMTINETSWFRDHRPFDALRTKIIPDLLAARSHRGLAIWCAAASSGQEPYSLAILMREHFGAQAATTRIIASDLSRDMLTRIDRGVYSQFEMGRGLPARLLARYFTQSGADWVVKPELRSMLELREVNLAAPLPALPPIDIVLIRNVLIYFDQDTKQSILNRIRRAMARDGALLLGGGETTLGLDAGLERCVAENVTYYRPQPRENPR